MPFKNENTLAGLPRNDKFQKGRSNVDNDVVAEQGIPLGWSSDPAGSYVYYECTVGVMLDSGLVIHNRLPQVESPVADSLASTFLDSADLDRIIDKGLNMSCRDQYTDIVQRMGHARYWFRIWGMALRVGYQVPIPGIKTIAGVPAIPYDRNPQWAYNSIAPGGNYSGLILWRAMWSLWYTIATPPVSTSQPIPAADPMAHISVGAPIPPTIQSPYSASDDAAQVGAPGGLDGFIAGKP